MFGLLGQPSSQSTLNRGSTEQSRLPLRDTDPELDLIRRARYEFLMRYITSSDYEPLDFSKELRVPDNAEIVLSRLSGAQIEAKINQIKELVAAISDSSYPGDYIRYHTARRLVRRVSERELPLLTMLA